MIRLGWLLAAVLGWAVAGALPASAAEIEEDALESGGSSVFPQLQGSAMSLGTSRIGGAAALAALTEPFAGRGFQAGPRLEMVVAPTQAGTRWDLSLGVESALWFGNAFGPGLAGDFVMFSQQGSTGLSPGYRIEPFFALRLARFRETGAWALRAGTVYDSRDRWGFRVGLTLQLDGVPNPASGG